MTPEQTLEEIRKLSPEDYECYMTDMAVLGKAMIRQNDDGTVDYVPRSEWMAEAESKQGEPG